jgi:hypothetical protein
MERRDSNPTWDTLIRALRATGHDIALTRKATHQTSIDLGQLRERLALSPAERLASFQRSQANMLRLRAQARKRSRD